MGKLECTYWVDMKINTTRVQSPQVGIPKLLLYQNIKTVETVTLSKLLCCHINRVIISTVPTFCVTVSKVQQFLQFRVQHWNSLSGIAWKVLFFRFLGPYTHVSSILGPVAYPPPRFGLFGDISSGFQSQSGFCLSHIVRVNVMYIRQDPPLMLHVANLPGSQHCTFIISRGLNWTQDH